MVGHASLQEFIERIILENNRRRDDLRIEDNRRVDEAFTALDKALKLKAEAVPTTRDFNELKSHVDRELAARAESSRSLTVLFMVLSGLALLVNVTMTILTYLKG